MIAMDYAHDKTMSTTFLAVQKGRFTAKNGEYLEFLNNRHLGHTWLILIT